MDEFLWVEKYRPKNLDACVLPTNLKNTLKEFVANGNVPNVTFAGGPGIGKTTAAKALLNELQLFRHFHNSVSMSMPSLRVVTPVILRGFPEASLMCAEVCSSSCLS